MWLTCVRTVSCATFSSKFSTDICVLIPQDVFITSKFVITRNSEYKSNYECSCLPRESVVGGFVDASSESCSAVTSGPRWLVHSTKQLLNTIQ